MNFTLAELKKLQQLLDSGQLNDLLKLGSVYDFRSAKEQIASLQKYLDIVNNAQEGVVKWEDIVKKDDSIHDRPMSSIVSPVELRITRKAFQGVSLMKKSILKDLRKRIATARWEDAKISSCGVSIPETLVWFFEAEEYLKVIKEFPWLLDNNLGEPESDDDAFFSRFQNPNFGKGQP